MAGNINNRRESEKFDVVQFIELPFEGIDDYVCVPHTWIGAETAKGVIVAYPNNEDPSVTRDRVKRKEKYNNNWDFYMAAFKYTSNSYTDAVQWIMKTNKYGPLVERDSKTSDTQSGFPLNRKLHSVNRNHSLKFNDNPRRPLPRKLFKRPAPSILNKQLNRKQMKLSDVTQSPSSVVTDGKTNSNPRFYLNQKLHGVNQKKSSKFNSNSRKPLPIKSLKRPAPSSLKKQLDGNQMKLSNAAQPSSAVVTDDKTQPNRERLIIIQNNQSMECAQADEAAAASIENERTKRSTPTQREEQNIQALNLPVIDVIDLTEVNNIDEENDSQGIKKANKNKSQCHLVGNRTAVLMTAKGPSTLAKQTTQQIQFNSQEHMSDVAQLSNFVVTDDKTESNRERLIIMQNNQSMECAQTDEAAAASIGNERTKQRTPTQREEQNIQALNLPVIDVIDLTEVNNVDEENDSQGIKKVNKNKSQCHHVGNRMAVLMTAKGPSTLAKQTTQQIQCNSQEHMSDAAQLSNFVVTDDKTESNRERLIIIQSDQSMECAQTDEAATEQRTPTQRAEQNIQAISLPVIDVNEPPQVIVINEENYSQGIKKPDKKNSQSHLISNTTAISMTPEEPPTSVKQTTQKNHFNNKEHILYSTSFWKSRIENVRSAGNVHIDHELLVHEIANYSQSTSDDTLSSVKKSAQLNNLMSINDVSRLVSTQASVENEIRPLNIKRDLAVAVENSSVRSAEEQLSVVSHNHSQDGLPVRETQTRNSKEQIGLLGSSTSSFEKTQHVPKINAKPHDTSFVDPRNVFLNASNIANRGKSNNLIAFHQNSYQPTYPNSIQQDLHRESKGSNNKYDLRPNSPIIRKRIPSTGLNTTNPCNPLYLTSELPQDRQSQLNQQDFQRQPQILKGEQRYTSNIATQGKNLMACHQNPSFNQNPYQPTYQNSFQRDLLRECKGPGNKYDHRPKSPTFRKRIPSTGLNSTNPCNPLYLNSELPQQRQFQLHQQDLQPPPQILKGEQLYTSNIATQGRNLMAFYQNVYQPTYQNSFTQDLHKQNKERNKYNYQPNAPTIFKGILSTEFNTTIPSNNLYLTSELLQQRQSQLHQQDLQRQEQMLRGEQLYKSNIATQGKTLMSLLQNPYQPTYQNSLQRDSIRECKEGNKYDHRPKSQTTRKRIPSTGLNSTNPSNPLYLSSEPPQQRQFHLRKQDLQQPPQILKGEQLYTRNIATQGKNLMAYHQNTYNPTYRNNFQQDLLKVYEKSNKYDHQPNSPTTTKTSPYTGPNSTDSSIPLYLSATEIPQQRLSQPNQQDLLRQPQIPKGEQRLQELQNHLNVTNNVSQIDEWLEKETLSPNHRVSSVANAVTNNIVISNHETVDAPIKTANNFNCNETASGSRCVDKPIAAQNSTFPNCQTHPSLEQQMFNNVATLLTEMSYNLHFTRDIYNNLQSSIRDTAELYEKLLGEDKDFNTAEYSVSNASPASNLTPDVSCRKTHSSATKSKFK